MVFAFKDQRRAQTDILSIRKNNTQFFCLGNRINGDKYVTQITNTCKGAGLRGEKWILSGYVEYELPVHYSGLVNRWLNTQQ